MNTFSNELCISLVIIYIIMWLSLMAECISRKYIAAKYKSQIKKGNIKSSLCLLELSERTAYCHSYAFAGADIDEITICMHLQVRDHGRWHNDISKFYIFSGRSAAADVVFHIAPGEKCRLCTEIRAYIGGIEAEKRVLCSYGSD